ncbi:MAG: hypothetical protein AAGA12_14035 [Pseudomonadota bacterium]
MKAWLCLIAALAFGVAPFVTDGFAGFRADQFPIPQTNPPVQPAGYAFSIWSIIYLWLLIFAINGVWKHRDDHDWDEIWLPAAISMGIGAVWIKAATTSVLLATVLIWAMLITALWALFRARNVRPGWLCALPLGLYAGWLSAASLVSIGLVGAGYGIVLDEVQWAALMLIAAFLGGAAIAGLLDWVWTYPLALCWATAAIMIRNIEGETWIMVLAGLVALVFAAVTLRQITSQR